GSVAGAGLGGVFAVSGVADVLRGSRPGRTGRLFGSSRSAIDQHRVVTPQVLRQASRPATASVRAAAATSTTPTEVCCRSSPPGAWCNVVRQAGDPRRTDMVQHLDLPVTAYPSGEPGGGGLGGGQAGDGVDGEGPPFLRAVQGPDAAGEADGLGGVREGEPGGDGDGFEGAVLFAAVPAVALAVAGRD